MAEQWYYADGKDPVGPFPPEHMMDMVRGGRIKPETMVWQDGMEGWEPAGDHFFRRPPDTPATGTDPHSGATNYAARITQRHQQEGKLSSADPRAYAEASIERDRTQRGIGSDGLYEGAPSRSFVEAIKVCFRKYATFKGRASRSEYWWFALFVMLASIIGAMAEGSMGEDGTAISAVISIATFLPSISAQVRRLHDTDRSGWWVGGYLLASVFGGIVIGLTVMSYGVQDPAAMAGMSAALLAIWGIVMLVWGIALFVFMVQRGTRGPNRFG